MAPVGIESRRWRRCRRLSWSECGTTTLQYAFCVTLTCVLVVWMFNLGIDSYGKGAVRSAVDEAARAGSQGDVDSVSTCEQRAQTVLNNLLRGPMGAGVRISCSEAGGLVRARADATFASWLPPFPDVSFSATGEAMKETSP